MAALSEFNVQTLAMSVPKDALTYLSSLKEMLGTVDNHEEQTAILEKVIGEFDDASSFIGLLGHHEGSRLLEYFCSFKSVIISVFGALSRADSPLYALASDKISSHVLQSLIINIRPFLGDTDTDVACSVFGRFPGFVTSESIENKYFSHLLRSLLVTISGRPLFYEAVIPSRARTEANHPVPSPFKRVLKSLLHSISAIICGNILELCVHQTVSPLIQMLLLYETEPDLKLKPSATKILLTLFESDHSSFLKLADDRIGSRIVEVFLYCELKQKKGKRIVRTLVLPYLRDLIRSVSGNFTVQAILKFCESPSLLSEMSSKIEKEEIRSLLSDSGRLGVIFGLVDCSCRLGAAHKAVINICQGAKKEEDLVSFLLSTNKRSFTFFGCSALSRLFDFPLEFSRDISKRYRLLQNYFRIVHLPTETLVRLSVDGCGSRVLESFFNSKVVASTCKEALTRVFLSVSVLSDVSTGRHLADIAADRNGSHVIDAMFSSASLVLKALINEQLSEKMALLNGSIFGRLVMRNCFLHEFCGKGRAAWEGILEAATKAEDRRTAALDEIFGGEPAPHRGNKVARRQL